MTLPTPADPPSTTASRLPSLDGWRALAIAMVMGSHFVFTVGFPAGPLAPLFLVLDGELGVRIFFVISGFIITKLLIDEDLRHGEVSLRLFYARRSLRILPIYFAYLAVLALLVFAGRCQEAPSSWIGCLTFTRNMLGRGDSGTVHFWSLAVEEQFYLFWPVLFVAARLRKRSGAAFAILGTLAVGSVVFRTFPAGSEIGGNWIHRLIAFRSALRYADSLAVGCAGAFALFLWRDCAATLARLCAAPLALILLFIENGILQGRAQDAGVGSAWGRVVAVMPALQALTVLVMILGTLSPSGSVLFRLLNTRLVLRIGVLSYSLYVWHFLYLYHFLPNAMPLALLNDWKTWWIAAVVTAVISYDFLESPFLRVRSRFSRSKQPA